MSDELQNEWARMNRAGGAVRRKKMIASLASIAVTFVVLIVGYVVLLGLYPFDRIPVVALALPWFPALPAGWFVRRKLTPSGALAG